VCNAYEYAKLRLTPLHLRLMAVIADHLKTSDSTFPGTPGLSCR